MKKLLKITLVFMIVLLTMLCTKVLAASEKLEPVSVEVTAPEAGIYGEGQEITITCTFDKAIKGTLPKYKISFLDSGEEFETIELETEELTEFTNEVVYKYTIKSGDNGELFLYGFKYEPESLVEDESGNQYYVNGYGTEYNNTILADTTIEWTDFSNVKIEPKIEMGSSYKSFNLEIKDSVLNLENDYYIHLSHDENEEITIKNRDEVINNSFDEGNKFWQKEIHSDDLKDSIISGSLLGEIFVETGDIFITICEIDCDTKVPKIVLKSKKIDKLPSLPISQRMKAYFFEDKTSTYCYELHSENQQNINYKIGKVTDLNLLKSLKDGEYSALQELMDYAKEADSIGTGTVKLGKDNTITDKLDLIDDGYYYVYLQLDTVNGKYVVIEDVMLYQALVGESVGKNLFSMDDDQFEWNLEEPAPETTPTPEPEQEPEPEPEPEPEKQPEPEPETKDETTAEKEIPHAGLEKTIILLAIGITIVSVIASKKYGKYRDII